jgi:hypothetical protein
MTDIQNLVIMLSKTDEEFVKKKDINGDWEVSVDSKDFTMTFNKDGSLKSVWNNRPKF